MGLAWLALVVFYSLGAVSATREMWPYSQVLAAWQFVAGHPEERTTLWKKIMNDTGVKPLRHTVTLGPKAHPVSAYAALDGLPLKSERDPPLVYLGAGAPKGFRIIFGVFDFKESLHGAILLDPNGKVQNTWQITQNDLPWPHEPDHLIFPRGFEVTRDGSIIVAYDGGNSLTKYDYCGRKRWQVEGGFHHSVELFDEETFWVWGNIKSQETYGTELMQMSVEDGSIIRTIGILDIIRANPDSDILEIRQIDTESGANWAKDPLHRNDIDALREELAGLYPGFAAGDLLVSMRSINLVFVLDPENLDIKWWRVGLARRQHDPDWNARGTITIFNNNMHRGYSSIVEVGPQTMERRILVDGADYDFYSRIRGKHQELPDGSFLITSSGQGRVFEVAPDGTVTFDFHNPFSEEHGALSVSEARFLPPGYFQELPTCED
ncbi:MAG: aryl-sulfate sulfotransferase [Acidobacteria bacterium]|nr:aryl-sulfate sulfotransferase [Acidobacteriota bacterium]